MCKHAARPILEAQEFGLVLDADTGFGQAID
jgi:2-methylisocitrate lyase-like PEP mutase family enzyme